MKKVLKKLIESYARNSTSACSRALWHEIKEPISLIKM